MNIIVIPARMGSKRLPGKPLCDINGVSMIERVAQQATKSKRADCVIVATDHDDILDAVCMGKYQKLVTAVMTDPECRTGTDRIAELCDSHIERGDVVVNLQGDLPFADPRIADQLFDIMDEPTVQMATACNKRSLPKHLDMYQSPNSVKVVMDRYDDALLFSRSPIPHNAAEFGYFLHHFGMYAYRRSTLQLFASTEQPLIEQAEQLEQLRVLNMGVDIRVLVTDYEAGQEINTEEDLMACEE